MLRSEKVEECGIFCEHGKFYVKIQGNRSNETNPRKPCQEIETKKTKVSILLMFGVLPRDIFRNVLKTNEILTSKFEICLKPMKY